MAAGGLHAVRALVVVAAMAAFAVVPTACGGSDADARAEIRDAIVRLQHAFERDDTRRACALLTEDAIRHVGTAGHDPPTTCRRDLLGLSQYVEQGRRRPGGGRPKVTRVEVDGDRASAALASAGGTVTDVPLRLEDGAWKVDAVYGRMPSAEQKDRFP